MSGAEDLGLSLVHEVLSVSWIAHMMTQHPQTPKAEAASSRQCFGLKLAMYLFYHILSVLASHRPRPNTKHEGYSSVWILDVLHWEPT